MADMGSEFVQHYCCVKFDIKILFKNRKAPIIPFNENILSVCNDLTSSNIINIFFKNLERLSQYKNKKGGIYNPLMPLTVEKKIVSPLNKFNVRPFHNLSDLSKLKYNSIREAENSNKLFSSFFFLFFSFN